MALSALPARRSQRWARGTLRGVLLIAFCVAPSLGLAQSASSSSPSASSDAPSPFSVQRLSDLRGHVATTYYGSWPVGDAGRVGGPDTVLGGATLSGALAFSLDEAEVALEASDLTPARQTVDLSVGLPSGATRLSWTRLPALGPDDEASTDLRLQQRLALDGLPRADATFTRRTRGDRTLATTLNATLADSYRQLGPELTSLRWRTGYRVTRAARGTDGTLLTHALRGQLAGEVDAREDGVLIRPGVSVDLRWDADDDARFQHRYDLSLDAASADRAETMDLSVDLRFDSERATATAQSVRYANARLAPLTFDAEIAADQRAGASGQDYRLGVGYAPLAELRLRAGYHGVRRTDASVSARTGGGEQDSNGVEASVEATLGTRPLRVSARGDVDLQIVSDGSFAPSYRAALTGRYGGEGLTGSLRVNYRHADQRGSFRLNGSVDLEHGPVAGSASAGVRLDRDTRVDLGVEARTRLFGAWSLQGRATYAASIGADVDRLVTVGMGLRYDFGGDE